MFKYKVKSRKPIRHQCVLCLKTFYKPETKPLFVGGDVFELNCCPYCGGSYIQV